MLKKENYEIFDCNVAGYEIHNAIAKKRHKKHKNLYGTFVHGFFESDAIRNKLFSQINENYEGYNFQEYKKNSIEEFAYHVEQNIDIDFIHKSLAL